MTTKKTDERDEGKKREDEKREHTEHAQQGIPKEAEVDEQNKSPPSINEPPGSDVMPPEVLEEIARWEREADAQAQQAARQQQKDQKQDDDDDENKRGKKR